MTPLGYTLRLYFSPHTDTGFRAKYTEARDEREALKEEKTKRKRESSYKAAKLRSHTEIRREDRTGWRGDRRVDLRALASLCWDVGESG